MAVAPETDEKINRRSRIRASAELLFAEHSYEAVSIRDIASHAGVNSALVRYYFGTKDELYHTLFTDRYTVIVAERLEKLAGIPEHCSPQDKLHAVVHAWVEPVAKLACRDGDANFLMLLARDQLRRDDEMHSGFRGEIDEMAGKCIELLVDLAPSVPKSQVVSAYTWFVSLAVNATANRRRTQRLLPAAADESVEEHDFVDQLLTFIVPGLGALLGIGDSTRVVR